MFLNSSKIKVEEATPSLSVSPIPVSDTVLVDVLPQGVAWGNPLLRHEVYLGSLHPLSPCCFRAVTAEYVISRAPWWLGS